VRVKFFLFDSERASGIVCKLRPPVKMIDFHGEVILYRFLTVLESEALLIIQLCFKLFKYIYTTVQM
jgi:hypothetical protein